MITEIKTPADLLAFREAVNAGIDYSGNTVQLTTDIDLSTDSKTQTWIPIGTSEKPFSGTFEGNNKKITGLYIDKSDDESQGLFGCIVEATIQNLSVSGSVTGKTKVGGIAGQAEGGTISHCSNTTSLTVTIDSIGGIVGVTKNVEISNCDNSGVIKWHLQFLQHRRACRDVLPEWCHLRPKHRILLSPVQSYPFQ